MTYPERIVAAAVHAYGATWSLPRPARHHNVLWAIDGAGLDATAPGPEAQGFLTSEGRFVGRREAAKMAVDAGQLAERICGEEGKDIRDVRMVLDVTKRVSKAMRLLQDQRAVRGEKDRMRRYVWRLV